MLKHSNLIKRPLISPIHAACRAGQIEKITALLAAGAKLNAEFAHEFVRYILSNPSITISDINKQLFHLPPEILEAIIQEAEIQGKKDKGMLSKRSERAEYYLNNMYLHYREEGYLWDQIPDPDGKVHPGIYIYYAREASNTFIRIVHYFGPPEEMRLSDLPENNLFSIWLRENHQRKIKRFGNRALVTHGVSLDSDVRMSLFSQCQHSDEESIQSRFSSYPNKELMKTNAGRSCPSLASP